MGQRHKVLVIHTAYKKEERPIEFANEEPTIQSLKDDVPPIESDTPPTSGNGSGSGNDPPKKTGGNGDSDSGNGDNGNSSDCKGFKSPQRLTNHFNEHNGKFDPPFANEQEYEQAGIDFMSGERENVSHQASFYRPGSRFHGDLVRYNEARNLFGMKTSDGFLRTFYRPINGVSEFFETFIPRS